MQQLCTLRVDITQYHLHTLILYEKACIIHTACSGDYGYVQQKNCETACQKLKEFKSNMNHEVLWTANNCSFSVHLQ